MSLLLLLAVSPSSARERGDRAHAKAAGARSLVARFQPARTAVSARRRGERRRGGRGRTPGRGKVTRPGSASRPGGSDGSGGSTGSGGSGGSGDSGGDAGAPGEDPRFGVFTDGSPYDGNVDSIDTLQAALGRDIEIVNWYQNWGAQPDAEWVSRVQPGVIAAVTGSGRTPLLTWEPWDPAAGADQPAYRLRAIADGAYDDYIASWADGLKATNHEIFLRPMHEMNGSWYPWGAEVGDNSPALYRAAWRRMHDIFAARGADNVRWVWCPLNADVAGTPMEEYYPGEAYVDVMALDGYNWGSRHPDFGGWMTFEQVFRDAYERLSKLGPQPIWIAEVGTAPDGGDKAQWVRDMWATARTWDRLEAVVWFDQDKEEDWRALPVASAFAAG